MAENLVPEESCSVKAEPEDVFACEVIRDETAGFINSLDYSDPNLTFIKLAGVAGKIRCMLEEVRGKGGNVLGIDLDRSAFEVTNDIYRCVIGITGNVLDLGNLPRELPKN
ncbi:hypothetical protein GF366_02780 [Candidatus Peregrinibacteria bacterium]|nr:hypothetical protein [Candidatus Peregrinibacteria bacterium]